MREEFEQLFNCTSIESNLAACPHEYQAMVTAWLSGKIGKHEYMMLIDSGSELNIMTMKQAEE